MYKEVIRGFSFENVQYLLKNDPIAFFLMLEKLSKRELSISETGIPRKTLYTWTEASLLPFPQVEGWGRFSFIETVWLKIVSELRRIGVSLEKILELKNFLFDDDFMQKFFDHKIDSHEMLEPNLAKKVRRMTNPKTGLIIMSKEMEQLFKDTQICKFSIMLMGVIMQRMNLALFIDATGNVHANDLNTLLTNPQETLSEFVSYLSNNSLAMINVRKIVMDISDSHEYFSDDLKIGSLMSENSVSALKKLFLDNDISELTIRVTENGRPTVYIKKIMPIEELQKEVHALTKKGCFKDLVVKTRDGNIKYFEKIELMQL